jgi:predicted esterase YcpF (UPF0227 family)
MTREKFIKKWLGNKDYQYTEENRDLMRDDLDEVINQSLRKLVREEITRILYQNSSDDSECMRIKFEKIEKIIDEIMLCVR